MLKPRLAWAQPLSRIKPPLCRCFSQVPTSPEPRSFAQTEPQAEVLVNKSLSEQSLSTNEGVKKIIIKNFRNEKDEFPNTIDIDNVSGEVRQISRNHDKVTTRQILADSSHKMVQTFLPNGYPRSVHPNYKQFTIHANLGATAWTTMSFLSTQSLFVALGSTMGQANLAAAAY